MDYSWVLSAWQVLLTCIYHLSVITREYYVHDRTHSRVLRARQDSLVNIRLLLVNTKVHDRSYLWVFSTRQRSLASSVLLCCTSPTHNLSSNFLEAWNVTSIFVNLDVSCTVDILLKSFKLLRVFCRVDLENNLQWIIWETITNTFTLNFGLAINGQ